MNLGKTVVTVYDFTYERYRAGMSRFVHCSQKYHSIRRADLVICISENTKKDLFEFVPGIDESRIAVVPLGVDSDDFHCGAIDANAENDLSDVILFVGQRAGYKRFDLAVDAVSRLKDLRLGIVGPPLSNEERLNLNDLLGKRWIEFGSVENTVLSRLYSRAFAFIYPSSYEGFGLPIIEAMACGCPVVASNLSSFPEVGGDVALFASHQEADAYVAQLTRLESTDLRRLIIQRGLEHVQQFSWERTFLDTLSLYRKL